MPDEFEGPEGQDDLESPPAFFPQGAGRDREPATFGELIEVNIEGVFAAESAGSISHFVLLSDGERKLPIVIGGFEANAISYPLEGKKPDRPLSHDLIRNIMDRLDSQLDRVVIDDLWNTTYYAKLYIRHAGQELEIDARPSDAVALAVRFDAPVFVADGILDQASEA